MWITRTAVAAAVVAMTGLPAVAKPIEIVTLGRAPVMGQSTSAAELQYNFKHNEGMMRQAADQIGLTREQYEQFRLSLEVGKPNWVTVPRHLDAMTWASAGRVHVLHDVIIPAGQKGIEYDMVAGGKQIAIFLPAKCGNLSVIRRNLPRVAAIRNFPVPHVAAVTVPPPPRIVSSVVPSCIDADGRAVYPTGTPASAMGGSTAGAPPCPVAAVAAVTPVGLPPVAAVHHGLNLLPLAALLPFLVNGGGGNTVPLTPTGTIVGPPPCP